MIENLNPEKPVEDIVEGVEENQLTTQTEQVEPTVLENEEKAMPIDDEKEAMAEVVVEVKQLSIEDVPQEIAESDDGKSKTKDLTKEDILTKLKDIILKVELPHRSEIEGLKHAYYKLRAAEIEQEKETFAATGNESDTFEPREDSSEDVLKVLLNDIKELRAKQTAKEEVVREGNYKKRLKIIEDIKELMESTDDFNKLYNEFKDLQQKWNTTTPVPQSKERELWTSYQIQSEMFYDLIKINNEFRDYDFKKNLEQKTVFCEAVEKLIEEADPVSAFHQLQNFHKQWREVGPVSKELREDLWGRFKDASSKINKRYQDHFEGLKGQEEENLAKKTAICDKLKTIDYSKLNSFRTWNDMSREVINWQNEWKAIGFVPRKVNTQIFDEFRKLCDRFFNEKSEFFKGMKGEMDENLKKKRALCDRSIALKDSTDWKTTTDELVSIQKEWKTIGSVPRKYSDAIWKEFVTACDHFFEQKKKNDSHGKEEEVANLAAKNAILGKIEAVDQSLEPSQIIEQVRILTEEWHKIGFVPFKEKDKSYKALHKAVDAHYDRLKVSKAERRMESFKSNVEGLSQNKNPRKDLFKERDNLIYRYNRLKSDLQTYENNMSFLSISSKGANNLLKDVNNKIEGLKNEMDLLTQKIATIDQKMNELE